jgi:hypothetical protein
VTANEPQLPRAYPFSVPMRDDMGLQLQDVSVIVKERSLLNSDPVVISENIRRLAYDDTLISSLVPTCKVKELVLMKQNPIGHGGERNDDRNEFLPIDNRDRLQPDYISVIVPTPLSMAARCSLAGAYLLAGQKISALHRYCRTE